MPTNVRPIKKIKANGLCPGAGGFVGMAELQAGNV